MRVRVLREEKTHDEHRNHDDEHVCIAIAHHLPFSTFSASSSLSSCLKPLFPPSTDKDNLLLFFLLLLLRSIIIIIMFITLADSLKARSKRRAPSQLLLYTKSSKRERRVTQNPAGEKGGIQNPAREGGVIQNSARERESELFKIQQERESELFKIQQEREELFKIQQEREKELFKIQQERLSRERRVNDGVI